MYGRQVMGEKLVALRTIRVIKMWAGGGGGGGGLREGDEIEERGRDKDRETQTDRQTDKQTSREKLRETDRQTDRQRSGCKGQRVTKPGV